MALKSSIDIDQIVIATVDEDPSSSGLLLPDGSIAIGIESVSGILWQKKSGDIYQWSKFFQLPPSTPLPPNGSVLFSDGTHSRGVVNFVWDNINSFLGINKETPASTLHLNGSYQNDVFTINITATENELAIGEYQHIHVVNTSNLNVNLNGIQGGRNGRVLKLIISNSGTGSITIGHNFGGSTNTNRILLVGDAIIENTTNSPLAIELLYVSSVNAWIHVGGRIFDGGAPLMYENGYEQGRIVAWGTTNRKLIGLNNIIWDNLNNRLGLNVGSNPLATLHVEGSIYFNLGSDQTGDMYFRNSSGFLQRLGIGSQGQFLKTSSSNLPIWETFDFEDGFTTYDERYLKITGGELTGFLTLHSNPVDALHAVTKSYVDNIITGLVWKEEVRVISLTNITLSGVQTIDSVELNVNDRVLVAGQTDPKENGIYLVKTDAWVRASDADSGSEIAKSTVMVSEGTKANTQWTCSNSSVIIGTTNIEYVQISGSGTYTNGSGLILTGNVFSIQTNGVSNSMLRQSVGTSVVGRSSDTLGDVADIQSTADNQILIRRSGSLVFTNLLASDIPDLDASKITTGTIPISRGGTNSNVALNNNRIMISSGGSIVENSALNPGSVIFADSNGIPTTDTDFIWDNINKRFGINCFPNYEFEVESENPNPDTIGGIVSSGHGNSNSGTTTISILRYGDTKGSDALSSGNLGQFVFAGMKTLPRTGASIRTVMENWSSTEFPTKMIISTVKNGSGTLSERISINTDSTTRLHDLGGTGDRIVQANADGTLSAVINVSEIMNITSSALLFSLIY